MIWRGSTSSTSSSERAREARATEMMPRRKTRQIQLGTVTIGGDAPITVQSMTKTDTRDVEATLLQIWALEAAGCDIVRSAVPVREAAEKLGEIKRQIRIPLVADIHFNYKLALIALAQGVDGLRLNPGNIGGTPLVMEVVHVAKEPGGRRHRPARPR